MNKIILTLVLLSSIFLSHSQTVIYQSDLSKDKPVVKYIYMPVINEVIVNEANKLLSFGPVFNKAIAYDSKASSNIIHENSKYLYLFSSMDNKLFGNAYKENMFSPLDMTFFSNQEKYKFKMKDRDFLNYGRDYYKTFFNFKPIIPFDQKYFYAVTGEDESVVVNIGKEDLYLSKFDISSQKTTLIPIKKPDVERLKTKDLIVPNQIPFQSRYYRNNTFEIVTKSVKKNYTSSTLYRDIYDLDGKLIKELTYEYGFSNGYIVPTNNYNSYENILNSGLEQNSMKPNILNFNDYFVDFRTNDFYIYGILDSKEPSGSTIKAPLGFYIVKFSENGSKLWEKQYDLSSENGFKERNQQFLRVCINLNQYCQNDISIDITGMNNYSNYYNLIYQIDNQTGKIKKSVTIDNKVETSKGTFSLPTKYSIFENLVYNKNVYFDSTTFLSISLNDKIKSYINKVNSKNEVFFNSIVSNEGIWLFETDNETYYKILFF